MRSLLWWVVVSTICITTLVHAGHWPLLMTVNIGESVEMGKQLGLTAVEVSPGIKFNPRKFEIENGEPANRSTQRLLDNVELAEKNGLVPVISLFIQNRCYKPYDYSGEWGFGRCDSDSSMYEQEIADETIEKIREMHAYFSKLSGGEKGRAENRIKLWRIGNEVQQQTFWVPPHVYAYFFQELSEEFSTDDARLAASFAVGSSEDTWYVYEYLNTIDSIDPDFGQNVDVVDMHCMSSIFVPCDEGPLFYCDEHKKGYLTLFHHEECLKGESPFPCYDNTPYFPADKPFCIFETHLYTGHPTRSRHKPMRFQNGKQQASELIRELVVGASRGWEVIEVYLQSGDSFWSRHVQGYSMDGIIHNGHGVNDPGRGLRKRGFRTIARLQRKFGGLNGSQPVVFDNWWMGHAPEFDPEHPNQMVVAQFHCTNLEYHEYKIAWCDDGEDSLTLDRGQVAINLISGDLVGVAYDERESVVIRREPLIVQDAEWVDPSELNPVRNAVDRAMARGIDVVIIPPGTCVYEISLDLSEGISLYGLSSPDHEKPYVVMEEGVVIDGFSSPYASFTELRGLHLMHSDNTDPSQPLVKIYDASPILSGNDLQTVGTAVDIRSSALIIEKTSDPAFHTTPLIDANVFINPEMGIDCYGSRPQISHNVMYSDRQGSFGIRIAQNAAPVLINNSIDGFSVQLLVTGPNLYPQRVRALNNIFMGWQDVAIRTDPSPGPPGSEAGSSCPDLRFNAFYNPGCPVIDCIESNPIVVGTPKCDELQQPGDSPYPCVVTFEAADTLICWADDYFRDAYQGCKFLNYMCDGRDFGIFFEPGIYTLDQIIENLTNSGELEAWHDGKHIFLRRNSANLRVDGQVLTQAPFNANDLLNFQMDDSWGLCEGCLGVDNMILEEEPESQPFVDRENRNYHLTENSIFRDEGCPERWYVDAEFLPWAWGEEDPETTVPYINDLGAYGGH